VRGAAAIRGDRRDIPDIKHAQARRSDALKHLPTPFRRPFHFHMGKRVSFRDGLVCGFLRDVKPGLCSRALSVLQADHAATAFGHDLSLDVTDNNVDVVHRAFDNDN
jgi:hypothetical protein